jgi:hypothetical protein
MVLLYHYTDLASMKAIVDSGCIRQSGSTFNDGRVRRDAAYGQGVYLTSLPPTTPKHVLILNNYDGSSNLQQIIRAYGNRVQCCFEFDSDDITPAVEKVGSDRDVWLYRSQDLILRNTKYETYRLD